MKIDTSLIENKNRKTKDTEYERIKIWQLFLFDFCLELYIVFVIFISLNY